MKNEKLQVEVRTLKRVIKMLVREAMDAPTIPAKHSEAEKEFSTKHQSWTPPQAQQNLKLKSPVQVKAKQVANILRQRGTDDADSARTVTQKLIPWLEDYDPQEMFVMSAADLADEFEEKFLKQ